MATEKSALRISELDFDTIRENLKTYLRSQSEFQDFDFEGSGMSVLLDVLAYNTHYMSYYLNMVGNEMFLDSAQLRESILSHAKLVNYFPASRQGALNKINVRVTPSTDEAIAYPETSLILDKYTRFMGTSKDGINYPFVTINSNTATKNAGSFLFSNVTIKQGEVITLQYLMDPTNDKRRFDIPSSNVDTTTIQVLVQESTTNTDTSVYTQAQDITELTQNSKVYFLEENEKSQYTLYFGDDVIGKKPKNDNVIVITYLDTVGEVSNNISRFVSVEPIGNFDDNVIVTSTSTSYGGIEKESIEQVRFRAPYFYSTQNRAVTKLDYETLILKDYNNIDAVSVWGGEDNIPVVYGKVFISLKTKGNYYLSNLDKETIKQTLIRNRNVLTIIPEIVDPNYTFIKLQAKVSYNPSQTSLSHVELQNLVRAAIEDYNDQELNTFKSTFRKSKLQTYIENADPSITGSDVQVLLQKRQEITLNQLSNYKIQFETPIRKGDFNQKLLSFPQLNVKDTANVSRNVFIEEVPQSFTGISSISVINPGIDYTTTPTVTITGDGIGATARAVVINRRINRIEITNAGSNYTRATVSITGGGGSQASAVAKLENKIGTLRTYFFKSNGEKVIVNPNAGDIDYDSGVVSLNSLTVNSVIENEFYDVNILTINVPVGTEIIPPVRNRILSIDFNDSSAIQIEMVPEQ